MPDANPISGPYTGVPATTYHASSDKYSKVVKVSVNTNNPFTATGSYSNPIGVSTNDNSTLVLLTFKNGDSVSPADMTSGVIYPFDILTVSGTFTAGKYVHLYY
jgi:hypothetical protein